MKARLVLVLIAIVSLQLTELPARAGARKPKVKAPVVQSTTIASVTADTVTINEGAVAKTFTVTPFTEITLNGQRAKLADLQQGMVVSVTVGSDPAKLSRLSATAAGGH